MLDVTVEVFPGWAIVGAKLEVADSVVFVLRAPLFVGVETFDDVEFNPLHKAL